MKDTQLHIRISAQEKEKFKELAEEEGMDLSGYFLTAAREKALKKEFTTSEPSGDLSPILEKIQLLEKRIINQNMDLKKSIQQLSPESREDLLLDAAGEKIFWMLQQEQFQKNTREEIKRLLLQQDPALEEFLEITNERLFTALDLALEKMEKEGLLRITKKRTIIWDQNQ